MVTILFFSVLACSKKSNCEIEIVNGLKTYKNSTQPAEPDLKVEFTKLMTIQARKSENDESLFDEISSLTADEQNSLYILDRIKNQVVILDSTGNLLKRFGRLGQGPGEFKVAGDLIVRRDSIIIYDAGHKKFHYFNKNGDFLFCRPFEVFFMFTSKMQKFKDNYLAYTFELFKVAEGGRLSKAITLFDDKFKKMQVIDSVGDSYPPKDQNIEMKFSVFANNDSLLVTGKRDKTKYQLKVYDTQLNQLYGIIKKYAAVAISSAEKQYLIEAGKKSEDPDQVAEDLKFSDYKFAFNKIWLDKNNYLWVDKAVSGNAFKDKFRIFDIFKDGIYLCSTEFPFGLTAPFEMDINGAINLWNINNRWICYDAEKQTLDIYNYKFTKH